MSNIVLLLQKNRFTGSFFFEVL